MEGLIYGGEICVSKSTGLALQLEVNLPFLLCFTLYLWAIFQVQAPRGAYIWRGLYMEGLILGILRYDFRLGDSAQCTQDHFIIMIHHSKKLQFYSLFKHDYKISSYLD